MADFTAPVAPLWRLILSPPAGGVRCMALDEALLEACAACPERFQPVLRLYAFAPVCLSIGRFQRIADIDEEACVRRGVAVVRRPSGGRAVLHDRCLTYALVAPVDVAPFAGGVRASAHRIGGALAAGLGRLGVQLTCAGATPRGRRSADCFAGPGEGEIIADGAKLVGSAQVRRGGAALQHGTIRLRSDAGIAAPLLRDGDGARDGTAHAAALDRAAGRPVTFTEGAAAVAIGFEETFGVTLFGTVPAPDELRRAAALQADTARYDAWCSSRSAQPLSDAASAWP